MNFKPVDVDKNVKNGNKLVKGKGQHKLLETSNWLDQILTILCVAVYWPVVVDVCVHHHVWTLPQVSFTTYFNDNTVLPIIHFIKKAHFRIFKDTVHQKNK